MRLIYGLALITTLVAVPAVAQAQQQQQPTQTAPGNRPRAQRMPRNPSDRILAHKDELKLTEAQIAQIKKIGAELEKKNQEVQKRMEAELAREGRQTSEADRAAMVQTVVNPSLRERRKNVDEAHEQILKVLEPEQQERAKEILRPNPRRARRPAGNPGT